MFKHFMRYQCLQISHCIHVIFVCLDCWMVHTETAYFVSSVTSVPMRKDINEIVDLCNSAYTSNIPIPRLYTKTYKPKHVHTANDKMVSSSKSKCRSITVGFTAAARLCESASLLQRDNSLCLLRNLSHHPWRRFLGYASMPGT